MPWYQSADVWVGAAAAAIVIVLLTGVWIGLTVGLERGHRVAADEYRARLDAAEQDRRAAWTVTRGRPAARPAYISLGYPDATQAMPAADTQPMRAAADGRAGPWQYPPAEGP